MTRIATTSRIQGSTGAESATGAGVGLVADVALGVGVADADGVTAAAATCTTADASTVSPSDRAMVTEPARAGVNSTVAVPFVTAVVIEGPVELPSENDPPSVESRPKPTVWRPSTFASTRVFCPTTRDESTSMMGDGDVAVG